MLKWFRNRRAERAEEALAQLRRDFDEMHIGRSRSEYLWLNTLSREQQMRVAAEKRATAMDTARNVEGSQLSVGVQALNLKIKSLQDQHELLLTLADPELVRRYLDALRNKWGADCSDPVFNAMAEAYARD